jgi:predicted Zn-dependent protease
MKRTSPFAARWAALISAAVLGSLSFGCATAGSLMEVAGNLSGHKELANAGSSFKRVAEVEDFTDEQKLYTGRGVAANLLNSYELSDNAALETYVGQVGQVLAQASGKANLPGGWHFVLIKDADPDAFAAPGGIILVSEGLVKLCQSEDELAGVLAHEIGHVALDHPMQAINASNRKNALVSLASFAVEAGTQGKEGSQAMQGQFKSVLGDVGKAVSQGYDRDKEKEADAESVRICTELGYDPRGLKRVLERLKKGDHSHGDPAERAKLVEEAAYALEPVPHEDAVRTERFKKALGR